MTEQDRASEIRREVLGDEYVERSDRNRNEFNADFIDLITRYSWGEIWSRPGLDRRSRSLITVALAIAQNRPEELALHLKAAVRNGVTKDELKEVLMHCTIYCGVPAANSAFRVAADAFE